MLKFLGSLFIVSSMTGLNLESRRSETLLSGVRKNISFDWNDEKNELSYAGSEFGEMFECLSKKMDAPYRNWLLGMKNTDGKKRWKDIF